MATYLPNVKEYIPQTETFTPDYKFLNDVLNVRQDRYDTNYKQMNNLYGSVVYADVSREDSKNTRDQYVNQLAPKLQQISGLDLSLQQNVDAAKALFTPFYEDKNLVRDMVFTKKWKSEMANAERLKNSEDEATRKQYWETGIKKLQYDMQDFVEASSEDMMNTALPQYVKQYDMESEGLARIKELDPNVQNVSFSEDGLWKITMKNGSLLTRQPIGENKEGEMQYSNPIGDYLSAALLNDPRAIDYYRTKGYVEARTFFDENKEQYGDKQAGMNAWGDQFLQQFSTSEDEVISELEEKERSLKGQTISWKNHIKKYGYTDGSDTDQSVKNTTAEYEAIKKSKEIRRDRNRKVMEGPSDNLTKALSMYMSMHMMNDINTTANTYASTHGEVDMDANPYAQEDIKQANRINLENLKQRNRERMEIMKFQMEAEAEEERWSGAPMTQFNWEGNQFNASILESEHDNSMSAQNLLTQTRELKKDDYQKLELITNWFAEKNANSGFNINSVEQCYEGTCEDGQDYYTSLEEIERLLALGDNGPLENAYQNMKAEYEALEEDVTSSPMGMTAGSLLYDTQRGIQYLNARELEHTEGARLWSQSNVELENYVTSADPGYARLVEETGISLFKTEEDGTKTYLSRAEFENNFVESQRFDSYIQEGNMITEMVPSGPDGIMAVRRASFPPTTETFVTTSASETPESGNTLSRVISFDEETAKQEAAGIYDDLVTEMDAVASKSTGDDLSMPSFNLAAFYDLKGQTGVGDTQTPWTGGVYDHSLPPQYNSGQLQTDQLINLMETAKGSDMVVKYGSMSTLPEPGELTDTDDGKALDWSPGVEADLKNLYTHLHLSQDAEGKKETRTQFTVRYNPNGPIYRGEDGEEQRYSVYEVILESSYAKSYNQPKTGPTGDKTTAFQDYGGTMSIYIPKGEYYNPADGGSQKHEWQRTINGGGVPTVSHPMGGKIEIEKHGGSYWSTITYKSYDPETHTWSWDDPQAAELRGVDDYNAFNNLQITLEQIMAQRAAENHAAYIKDNKQNK